MSRFLVFGATGALGGSVVDQLKSEGHTVVTAGRASSSGCEISIDSSDWAASLGQDGKFDGVVWAQGINGAGTVLTTSREDLLEALEANVIFIQVTLQQMVQNKLLAKPSRGVVISSMWQEHARANKFAYLVSKSALAGLVKSIAIDLASIGFSINAVLPGVIDTPMTRANLTSEQIGQIEADTLGGKLAMPRDVAQNISWLLSPQSHGLTSQFLTVDNGWTINRHV